MVQRCTELQSAAGVIGAACPFCTSLQWDVARGERQGRDLQLRDRDAGHRSPPSATGCPYPIVLVELDEQRAVPWRGGCEDEYGVGAPHRQPRAAATTPTLPEDEEEVAIGKRVEVCFVDIDDDHGPAAVPPERRAPGARRPGGPRSTSPADAARRVGTQPLRPPRRAGRGAGHGGARPGGPGRRARLALRRGPPRHARPLPAEHADHGPAAGRVGRAPAGALYLLPLWPPVLVAEQVASLASIASGPFVLQSALGDGRAQFAGMGAELPARRADFEAGLDVIRRLLAGETVDGDLPRPFTGAVVRPLPPTPVAVWIGGSAPPAVDPRRPPGRRLDRGAVVEPRRTGRAAGRVPGGARRARPRPRRGGRAPRRARRRDRRTGQGRRRSGAGRGLPRLRRRRDPGGRRRRGHRRASRRWPRWASTRSWCATWPTTSPRCCAPTSSWARCVVACRPPTQAEQLLAVPPWARPPALAG